MDKHNFFSLLFKLQKEKDEAKTNETKLKGLMEQMQDQFNELRANLAPSDDIDDVSIVAVEAQKVTEVPDHLGKGVTKMPDHRAEEITKIPDHHVADLIQDFRSV